MKYLVDHDYHIHTHLSSCCYDKEMTVENVSKVALQHGYKQAIITNHVWDSIIGNAPEWYLWQNYEHIKQEEKEIRLSNNLLFGAEAEFSYEKILTMDKSRFDELEFLIVPLNHLHMKDIIFFGDPDNINDYTNALMDRIDTFSKMDLPWKKIGVAHLTWNFNSKFTIEELLSNCDMDIFAQAFKRIADNGGGIELNSGCFVQDNPSKKEFELYALAKKQGCKFYLGSDAHSLETFKQAPKKFEYIVDYLNLTEDDKFVIEKK